MGRGAEGGCHVRVVAIARRLSVDVGRGRWSKDMKLSVSNAFGVFIITANQPESILIDYITKSSLDAASPPSADDKAARRRPNQRISESERLVICCAKSESQTLRGALFRQQSRTTSKVDPYFVCVSMVSKAHSKIELRQVRDVAARFCTLPAKERN